MFSFVFVYCFFVVFFFFNDTATTEIYTLSLHDALPISLTGRDPLEPAPPACSRSGQRDRKSTRLNSSHQIISYAVFCLKKKNKSHKACPNIISRTIATSGNTSEPAP